MIARNEEGNLADCLRSAEGLVDEMIVLDTGSTDRTREIAREFGAKVFEFPWVDDFAAARNESIRHATGDWIFWLDADDRVDADNRVKLKALFDSLGTENAGYCLKCLCLPDPRTGVSTVVDHLRLFRNQPENRWKYRVHEQIWPAIKKQGGTVHFRDVVIQHIGYQDADNRQRKLQRDLRLLELELAEQPGEPFVLFNLGSIYHELMRPADALPLLQRSLERSHPADSIVRKLHALIIYCHRSLGQPALALTACRAGLVHYPDDVELQYLHGMLLVDRQDEIGAEAVLLRLIGSREADHFGSVATGLQSYRARQLLATVYQRQGRSVEQEAQLRAALAENPLFAPAVSALGTLFLKQERWPEMEEMAGRLESEAKTQVDGRVLRARALLVRREFDLARAMLEETLKDHPNDLWPLVILSYVLLQEGRDLPAAEKVLRDILTLDPKNQEAQNNLAVLLRQLGKNPAA